jgi:hypothetical protein
MGINDQNDKFGIKKKYQTADSNREWFMDMDKFNEDNQVTTRNDGLT